MTSDLARDICPDIINMMNHSRPYIRKKVVLLLYRIFLKYPEALRLAFPRLKEKLEDPDPCEYIRLHPLLAITQQPLFHLNQQRWSLRP
jgi:hypothetical protein